MTTHHPGDFEDDDAAWRRCEIAWGEWLAAAGWVVARLSEAHGNVRGARAPLLLVGDQAVRAPDFQATQEGHSLFWEVKFRSRPHVDPVTGAHEHWMESVVLDHYVRVARASGLQVRVALHEAPTASAPARWLESDVERLRAEGRAAIRIGRGGERIEAWSWPVTTMDVVSDGPSVTIPLVDQPFAPDEGDQPRMPKEDADAIDHEVRSREGTRSGDELSEQAAIGLQALCLRLGVPAVPQYSVLRLGLAGVDAAELLHLAEYGIRVFVVSEDELDGDDNLAAYRAARLVEDAVVPGVDTFGSWAVDGDLEALSPDALAAFEDADTPGGINVGQYKVVHLPVDENVVVTAGAGTGKTETMAERVVFLLATDRPSAEGGIGSLGLDDMVLLTFTREAAAEMRARIARTLVIRQRLCPANVLPTAAWLTQLSSAQVTTIHSYAKRLISQNGAALGYGPAFRVAQHTLARRALAMGALGEPLNDLFQDYAGRECSSGSRVGEAARRHLGCAPELRSGCCPLRRCGRRQGARLGRSR